MPIVNKLKTLAQTLAILFSVTTALASDLDSIGITLLRSTTTNLNGSGIRVAQPEAGDPDWEVNPAIGQPVDLFTWYSSNGISSTFTNNLGVESGHADAVAGNFYGPFVGVAPGVQHVDNYQGDYFYEGLIATATAIPAKVVNQSFIFVGDDPPQTVLDSTYDNYIALYGNLFCSGIGNGGQVNPPGTCYNGIGVGVYGAPSSTGPTLDNGRSKPDLVAPGGFTSFSSPYVAGVGAILFQAAARGDGGANTNSAGDVRTIKALLLNGAVKPADWTHTISSPLDTRYGAGILNAFNSYQQLAGGQQSASDTSTVISGNPHPPTANPNNGASLSGWDFQPLANLTNQDTINHYYLNLPNDYYALTATLVWNRQFGLTNINDLDLFLYDTADNHLVASSVSTMDNVEHLYLGKLPPGRYDLQILKNGLTKTITPSETYALAFAAIDISHVKLTMTRSGTNSILSWPAYPTVFGLETTTNLAPPIGWAPVTNFITTNNLNQYTVATVNRMSFYRLRR